ncbi:hypothetical protein GJ496_005659 [Pomphorhynchus laevis]|nr:hypothetical protein GJ496_005659 [Pomphorhynchus laevis]
MNRNNSSSSIVSSDSDSDFDPKKDLASQLSETFWERFLASLQDDSTVNARNGEQQPIENEDDDVNDLDFDPTTQVSDQFEESVWSGFVGNILSHSPSQLQNKTSETIVNFEANSKCKEVVSTNKAIKTELKLPISKKELSTSIKSNHSRNDGYTFGISFALIEQIRSACQLILQSVILCYLSPLHENQMNSMMQLVISLTEKATNMKVPIDFSLKQIRTFIDNFPSRIQESICKDVNRSLLKWDLPPAVFSIINENRFLFPDNQIYPKCRYQPKYFPGCSRADFSSYEDTLLLIANQRFKHFGVWSDRIYMIHRFMMSARQGSEISKRLRRLLSSSSQKKRAVKKTSSDKASQSPSIATKSSNEHQQISTAQSLEQLKMKQTTLARRRKPVKSNKRK